MAALAVQQSAATAVEAKEKRVTIWNRLEGRKLSGNAAPMQKNLSAYLAKHPHCEVFTAQDKHKGLGLALCAAPRPRLEPSEPAPAPHFLAGGLPSDGQAHSPAPAPLLFASLAFGLLPGAAPQSPSCVPSSPPHAALLAQRPGAALAGPGPVLGPVLGLGLGGGGLLGGSAPLALFPSARDGDRRVTIWHTKEQRKISGNAAPMEKNLRSYLLSHTDCEVYTGQDKARGGGSNPHDPFDHDLHFDHDLLGADGRVSLLAGLDPLAACPSTKRPLADDAPACSLHPAKRPRAAHNDDVGRGLAPFVLDSRLASPPISPLFGAANPARDANPAALSLGWARARSGSLSSLSDIASLGSIGSWVPESGSDVANLDDVDEEEESEQS